MEKVFWLKLLCRVFYLGSAGLIILFFYLGVTGNRPGTDWRGGLLFSAVILGFLGLLGDVVGDLAKEINRRP